MSMKGKKEKKKPTKKQRNKGREILQPPALMQIFAIISKAVVEQRFKLLVNGLR